MEEFIVLLLKVQNLEKILVAGCRRRRRPPPTPHDPYETPEGALYIGYIPKGKEYLYTQEELNMFKLLEGVYFNSSNANQNSFSSDSNTQVPNGDPYAESPAMNVTTEQGSLSDNLTISPDNSYELNVINANATKPTNFSDFGERAFNAQIAAIPQNAAGAKRAVSFSQIKVLDLISEGEIEGLVDGEYKFTTPADGKGIGYTSFTKEPYKEAGGVKYLQSIFLNKVPIVDKDGLFNFQQVEVNVTNGSPEGDQNGIAVSIPNQIKGITDTPLTVVRTIGERLRGPNRKTGAPQNERDINHFSKYYKIINPNCDGVRINIRFDSFQLRNIKGGKFEPVARGAGYQDAVPISVSFAASFRKIFANSVPEKYCVPFRFTVTAKLVYGFIYEFRMPFHKTKNDLQNPDFLGYEIKITRLTEDAFTNNIQSKTTIDSITEIYHQKFTYPNSAVVSAKFSSEFFTQIPDRLYDVRLLKVKVPSNYDPILKKYDGDWDGAFKEQKLWTDNPAWCYYDLLTNKRYGLGDYISEDDVDKWTIYELAKYCDELVSDGEGGFEPRYVSNLRITEATDSYNALQNFSSIFRGFTYYMGGSILCTFDAKRDPIYTFTNANVKDGGFSYQGSAAQGRANSVLVRYNDQNNLFQPAIEYIEDPVSIKRNGYIKKDINAFGCTKKSYALRYGKWMMETENTELETLNFTAGLEGMLLRPGDVINISDRNRYARRLGGKVFEIINSESSASVTLDNVTPLSGNTSYNFTLVTPTYNLDQTIIVTGKATAGSKTFVSTGESGGLSSHFASGIRKPHLQSKTFTANPDTISIVTGFDGAERTKIVFNSKFDQTDSIVSGVYPFFISSNSSGDPIEAKQYRIISIKEENRNEFSINCLEVSSEKYDKVDSGQAFITPIALPNKPDLELTESKLKTLEGVDTLSIKYQIISPAGGTHKGYVIFIKEGTTWENNDFANNELNNAPPLPEYLVDSFSFEGLEDPAPRYYIPSSPTTYHFRVYTRNSRGNVCPVPASGSILFTSTQSTTKLFSVNSLVTMDQTFLASSFQSEAANEAASNQKNIDTTTGSLKAGSKIQIGPNYTSFYGESGVNELVVLAKEPRVSWQLGLPNFRTNDDEGDINVITEIKNTTFRISAREPSSSNLPSKFIYFEITGLTNSEAGTQEALSAKISYILNRSGIVRDSSFARVNGLYPEATNYKFPTVSQLRQSNPYYKDFISDSFSGKKGPFRNYDIVVEAIDESGNTSAGYNIYNREPVSTSTLKWNTSNVNSQGYDILEIRNPRPEQTIFTPSFRFKDAQFNFLADKSANDYFEENPQKNIDKNFPTLKILGANNNNPTLCLTKQFLTLDGNLSLEIIRDSRGFTEFEEMIDYRDSVAAIVLFSNKWFNVNTIKTGAHVNFQPSAFEEETYAYEAYTEHKPKGSKINRQTATNDNFYKGANLTDFSTSYTSQVQAKFIDLRPSPFSVDKTFSMKLGITEESYISIAFLDEIDVDTDDINNADNFNLEVLKKSKSYNFSPAVLIPVQGKASKEAGFRAYGLFRMKCRTVKPTDFPALYGATKLYDSNELLTISSTQSGPGAQQAGEYPQVLSPIGHVTGGGSVTTGRRRRRRHHPYSLFTPQGTFYYPQSISLEIFSFGISSSFSVLRIIDKGKDIAFEIILDLNEPIPVNNRIIMGTLSKSSRLVEDTKLAVIVPIPNLFTDHGFGAASEGKLNDHQFRSLYKMVRQPDGSDIWEQNAGFFTLVSNGLADGDHVTSVDKIIIGQNFSAIGGGYYGNLTIASPKHSEDFSKDNSISSSETEAVKYNKN